MQMYDAILTPSNEEPGDLLAASTNIFLGKDVKTVGIESNQQGDMNSLNMQDAWGRHSLYSVGKQTSLEFCRQIYSSQVL